MRFHHKAALLQWAGTTTTICSLLLFLGQTHFVQSLHREDAGVLDFVIATAGHGVTRHVSVFQDTLLTSDSGGDYDYGSSCYVASRKTDSGNFVWRRNVCSNPSPETMHALAVSTTQFYTLDSTGVARAWSSEDGNLVWDAQVAAAPGSTPGVWTAVIASTNVEVVAAASQGDLTILNAESGAKMETFSAVKALSQKLKSEETVQWLSVVAAPAGEGSDLLHGVVAFLQADGTTSGNRMWTVTMQVGNDEFTSVKNMGNCIKATILASSFQAHLVGGSLYGLALSKMGESAVTCSLDGKDSDEIAAGAWNPAWARITAIRSTANPSMITVQGVDGEGAATMGLFRFIDKSWEELKCPSGESSRHGGVAYCPEANLLITMGSDALKACQFDSMSPLSVTGDMYVPDGDFVENLSVVQCTAYSVTTLLSTAGGTTTQISFSRQGKSVTAKMGWTAEEGLASVSSAVVLDASHLGSDDLVEEQEAVANKLSLSSRLSSQLKGVLSLFSWNEGEFNRRDHIFGFVKIAALLSQTNHRIWGVKTSGNDRGSVRWSIDLLKTADWHTMVHGTTNSPKALHGINGGTHSREILVVSATADTVEWKCIDGTNGVIHAQESALISSPVLQVVPVYGSAGACRQAALLLHEDRTLTVVPGDADTHTLVKEQLAHTQNGMYAHLVDKISSKLESFQIYELDSGTFAARQVGRTSFAGERIVKVAYPIRDEIIQTMSHILGDNSLLLKYINPHLAVIITVSEDSVSSKTNIAASLEKKQGEGPKRKPAGVGDAATVADSKNEEPASNLFVNLVDTVSGRVLHRASHANADVKMEVTALISENWVIYSFTNAKSRRTEIGVLTLHEGMIDPKGIGIFKSPEQTTGFSSFNARETKPVVLSKTYMYPKHITALGVTATRGGISARNILIASDDGKIASIRQVMLETRRPMGEVKDAEKTEGLFPYSEMIVQVPLSVISHNHTVESVTSVVSAPTTLESQSLIFAFGGPDLFFTRTSPSKGFDLLPDSYSRILVSIVTAGLVIVLFVIQRMASQKALKQGWL